MSDDFQTLFERMSDPAVVVEGGGRVVAANLAFAVLAAQPAGALAGRELASLIAPEGDGAAGRLFVGEGQGSVAVRLESVACGWAGEGARLVFVRPTRGAEGDGRGAPEPERLRALLDYLQEATDQLEVVNRVVAAVNSGRDIGEVFELASTQIRSLVPFDRATIILREEDGETLRLFAISGERAGVPEVGARGRLRGSVTEKALAERRTIVVTDLEAEPGLSAHEEMLRAGFRSAVCVPLFSTRDAVGSLNLWSHRRDAFDRRHLLALERLAPPLAVAIEKVLLLEASRERNEELRGLFEISRAFSALADTSELSGRLARAIARLVGGEMCLIATYDRRTGSVRGQEPGHNTPAELVAGFHFKLEREDPAAPVYQTGEAFLSNDPARDPRLNREFAERWGVRSALCVPMRIKQELIGFIYVANRAGGFSPRELRLLEIFAAQAAETVVNARLFTTIQAQAEREAVVNRLLLSLQRGGEPHEKVRSVIERIGEVLELDRCTAVLFADDERQDYYGEWCADGVAPITHLREVRERSPLRHALRTARRPLYARDVREHPLAAGLEDLIGRAGLKSLLVVPVMHLGRVVGSISAHQTRDYREWTEDDVDLLVAVATHVGATLENARLISELREANRLKDQFLATLSHELRTPLTAITGWVEILSEGLAPGGDEDLSDGIQAISSSAHSLTQLISDLLDLSRIQRGVLRLVRDPLDINRTVAEAARNVRQTAAARNLDLRVELAEGLPVTIADPQRVRQVLWNLLSNAIKFTPKGGRVTVRTRLAGDGEGGRRIEVEVEDTGEGIPEDFMPHIWERFRQADSTSTRRHGGLGIGLSLVKELVEAHGGTVSARSDASGSRFTVSLPVIELEELQTGETPR
ncbi:MAG TPA: GAF domain-containing sensor histidine kinase [Pyrinomonadaceae bacterium]|nr:GAF domain-containing sensor histidine kinase [Pyrinomonadaceae bacterium]